MEENWYALAVAILKYVSPEDAFNSLETGNAKPDVEVMIDMKEHGLSYLQMAKFLGIKQQTVSMSIKRYKDKLYRRQRRCELYGIST